jgi:hypothetical protein
MRDTVVRFGRHILALLAAGAGGRCAPAPSGCSPQGPVVAALPRPYSGPMNPRVRRLIVSGVLGGLVLIVVLAAVWDSLR